MKCVPFKDVVPMGSKSKNIAREERDTTNSHYTPLLELPDQKQQSGKTLCLRIQWWKQSLVNFPYRFLFNLEVNVGTIVSAGITLQERYSRARVA